MHLLILDDEERICTFVADVATGAGWTAETAGHKVDFRSQLFRRLPDAVILDLRLGETDGISEMRFLAQCQFRGPIGLMSGFDQRVLSSAQQIGESLGLHVVDVLEKPIRAATLRGVLAAFENILAGKPDLLRLTDELPQARRPRALRPAISTVLCTPTRWNSITSRSSLQIR